MDKTDNYLLLLIGVLLISLIAVELIPLPETGVAPTPGNTVAAPPIHKPFRFSSAARATVVVIPTTTLATVTVK